VQEDLQAFFRQGIFLSISPKTLLVGWGELKQQENPASSQASFYSPDFFLKEEKPWIVPEHCSEVDIEEFQGGLTHKLSQNISLNWKGADLSFFREQVEDLKIHFSTGKLSKAVPIVFEESSLLKGFHEIAFRNLLPFCSKLNLFGFWTEEEGILGATPEILFESNRPGHFQTMALAGTDPSHKKDCSREHQVVIEDIATSLKKYGRVDVQATQTVEFAYLAHLRTLIELETREPLTFLDLISILHPTAALGAIPKPQGRKWLEKLNQKQDRRCFGAPFGVLWPNGNAKVVVAIRNVQWDKEKMILGAGCGVLEGVDCEQEWKEIQLKISSVKKMMGFV